MCVFLYFVFLIFSVKMVFISHILLKITKRDSETIQLVNLSKANLKPMSGKMVSFSKKLPYNKRKPKDYYKYEGFTGLKWYNKKNQNEHQDKPLSYKYLPENYKEYNKTHFKRSEIIIFAKPGKITSYIYYSKNDQKLYYGATTSSFTFFPNQTIHIYSEEHDSSEEIPLFIDVIMVNGGNNIQPIKKDYNKAPIPPIMLKFLPRKFSESFDLSVIESPIFGEEPTRYEIYTPYTGINRKELIKRWLQFKSGIPRQVSRREVFSDRSILPTSSGYDSDTEPLDVRRDRLRRNRAIEAAIDAMNYDIPTNTITLDNIPTPDSNGYIHFGEGWPTNYSIDNPKAIYHHLLPDDNGFPSIYTVNGQFFSFNPEIERRVQQGSYAFYWCPTDGSFGVRYKKIVIQDNNNEDAPGGGESSGTGERNHEDERAHMVNKYIYLQVLNDVGDMIPTTIDLYTRSYYHLGRINYEQFNIDHKEQISITKRQLEDAWEERFQ